MTEKFVYLAGPIAGCDYGEATDWREYVSGKFRNGITGISPMRLKEWCQRVAKITDVDQYKDIGTTAEYLISGESHAIAARDFNDVKTADMLLVNLPKVLNDRRPSWGTAIEIGWAAVHRVPIVLVTDDDNLAKHPLVRESVGWIVPNLDMGIAVINSVLGAYVGDGK